MAQVSGIADEQSSQTKTLRIARFNPEKDTEKQFIEFPFQLKNGQLF